MAYFLVCFEAAIRTGLSKSNRESGDGFSDILIMPEDPDAGIVIEVKVC